MSRSIESLSSRIEFAARKTCGDSARALLKPVIQEGEYLLSSDICIRIARRLGQHPGSMAQRLLAEIAPIAGERWREHAGYINLLLDPHLLLSEPTDAGLSHLPESSIVYLPRRPAWVSRGAMARLASLAVLQVWFLRSKGNEVQLRCGASTLDIGTILSVDSLFRSIMELHEGERSPEATVEHDVLEIWHQFPASSCTFFLCPGDVEHTLWKQGGKTPGFDEQVQVTIPDRGWFAGVDPLPVSFDYLKRVRHGSLSLMLHLGSQLRGEEVEWHAPCYQEHANLLWTIESTGKRFLNLRVKSVAEPDMAVANLLPREMPFLMKYLPAFHYQVLVAGEIFPFIAAVQRAVAHIVALLNDPALRISFEQGEVTTVTLYSQLDRCLREIGAFFHVDE